jgi:site-specific recombinase XerD
MNRTKDIFTQEEVLRMIATATAVQDKAIISTLYESGCRIGELLSMRRRDVRKCPHGFQITVRSITCFRRLLLTRSALYLAEWTNRHPERDNFNALLWITNRDHQALTHGRICRILQRTVERANVRKTVNTHNFRRSRAMHLAKRLTEGQMKEYFGWV